LGFQQVIRFENGGRAYLAAGAGVTHGRQAIAGAQNTRMDRAGNFARQCFVTFQSRPQCFCFIVGAYIEPVNLIRIF
jgi:hypothetical protein